MNSEDGFTDLSDHLDNYMQHKGWKGQKVFTSQYGAKIGTTSTTGYLLSPILNNKSSNLTIRFTAKAVTSAGANIQFIVMSSSGNTIELQECKLYYQPNRFIVNFENIDATDIKVKITSQERIYLSDIIFFDGFFVESDFTSSSVISHSTGTQSTTYDDILENKLYLTNLTEDIYRYRVRANISGAKSGWSPYREVNIQNESKIEEVNCDWDMPEINLYNLDGKMVTNCLQSGIYIIRHKTGTAKKVIIK